MRAFILLERYDTQDGTFALHIFIKMIMIYGGIGGS